MIMIPTVVATSTGAARRWNNGIFAVRRRCTIKVCVRRLWTGSSEELVWGGKGEAGDEPLQEPVRMELGHGGWVRGCADAIVEPAEAEGAHVDGGAGWSEYDDEPE